MRTLGFDTSNYTTSAAIYDREAGVMENCGRLLPVPHGSLGLRQSDAVFAHVGALPGILETLDIEGVSAIGVSTRPRSVPGSYMPCFTVGSAAAHMLAHALGIPCHEFSHQEGHLAAVLVASGCESLFNKDFLAWHLSGGTTELLYVKKGLEVLKIGGTSDISAGQLIDRTGVLLGIAFPAGRELDNMACGDEFFKIKQNGLLFSLSGMENKVQNMALSDSPQNIAGFVLNSLGGIIARVTASALDEYGDLAVVLSGGVAGSSVIRRALAEFKPILAPAGYSSDNALGVAALAYMKERKA
ncbi:MAG: DNA-binding protein [Clostridia bacterium]